MSFGSVLYLIIWFLFLLFLKVRVLSVLVVVFWIFFFCDFNRLIRGGMLFVF